MKAIGIDLGTTNSAVAAHDPHSADIVVLTNSKGERLTPSVVGLATRQGRPPQPLVGEDALNWAIRQPKDTVVSVKRLMGRHLTDTSVAEARGRLNYEIVAGPDDDPRAHVVLGEETLTPAEISRMILEKLVQDATRTLGEQVTHAVITVPAYFRDAQRAATREAAERAGLVVKKIVDEPTAAAVAFGLNKPDGERSRVLVYDLGGGTFDISVLNAVKDRDGNSQFQVLRSAGDIWLGGDDFDLAVVDRIIAWMRDEHHVDPSDDKAFLFQAKKAAERAKRELNDQDETYIVIPAAYRSQKGVLDVEMALTRAEFTAMIAPLVSKTMDLVTQTLGRYELATTDISDVLLVGGGTLTRPVYEAVEAYFGKDKVRRNIGPMECVALGAGVLAETLDGVECPDPECAKVNEDSAQACVDCAQSLVNARPVGSTGLYESTPMAMGIAAVKGSRRDVFVEIIPAGSPYPLPEPRQRTFHATDSRRIRVPVYEGDSKVASENHEQGVVEFDLPQEIEVNRHVDVSFNYSSDRIITVRISVRGTDMTLEATPNRERPLTPPPETGAEVDSHVLREELGYAEREADDFLKRFGTYVEPVQAMKVRRDIEQAQQAAAMGDSGEYKRLTELLLDDVFHQCGLASQFRQAELASEGAPRDTVRQINEAVDIVKQAHRQGNRVQTAQQARNLRSLVAVAQAERRVQSLPDRPDYGGILQVGEDTVDG
ncbi:Hsp70 family protein [Streptomyces sp. NBC_01381]|uniref:Hsp70 family protein n=1 Tax=Streptomyces sp. NBC_01381 TaxID=2903845 RepID=UPI002258A007|nr:Hsp70 family protein [Streptomyces sp. NBC_01381]MCX4670795.1 Hsp70 family protein [Streptomyces sp. NBC_01381]